MQLPYFFHFSLQSLQLDTHCFALFRADVYYLAVLFGLLRYTMSIVHGLKAQLSVSCQKFGLS